MPGPWGQEHRQPGRGGAAHMLLTGTRGVWPGRRQGLGGWRVGAGCPQTARVPGFLGWGRVSQRGSQIWVPETSKQTRQKPAAGEAGSYPLTGTPAALPDPTSAAAPGLPVSVSLPQRMNSQRGPRWGGLGHIMPALGCPGQAATPDHGTQGRSSPQTQRRGAENSQEVTLISGWRPLGPSTPKVTKGQHAVGSGCSCQ